MERRESRIGPGAASLLLVTVVVSMCILGILTMLNARSDIRLTERSTALITARYEAAARAERDFAVLDGIAAQVLRTGTDETALDPLLPEGMQREGRRISWQITVNETTVLRCEAELGPHADGTRLRWTAHTFVSTLGDEDEDAMHFWTE